MFVQFFFEDYIYIFNANNISSPRDIIFETIYVVRPVISRGLETTLSPEELT